MDIRAIHGITYDAADTRWKTDYDWAEDRSTHFHKNVFPGDVIPFRYSDKNFSVCFWCEGAKYSKTFADVVRAFMIVKGAIYCPPEFEQIDENTPKGDKERLIVESWASSYHGIGG